ncbi:unnamed protein product [Miscanthus lutarioriparius]|uniref:Uncharacterized protein n=1 Tax=Miscanthus lutarioriparius TaxID=422564 RepID=A0A811QYT8_9POAL|nr:unnamed protein product [Miscanthus lutarioriparius]
MVLVDRQVRINNQVEEFIPQSGGLSRDNKDIELLLRKRYSSSSRREKEVAVGEEMTRYRADVEGPAFMVPSGPSGVRKEWPEWVDFLLDHDDEVAYFLGVLDGTEPCPPQVADPCDGVTSLSLNIARPLPQPSRAHSPRLRLHRRLPQELAPSLPRQQGWILHGLQYQGQLHRRRPAADLLLLDPLPHSTGPMGVQGARRPTPLLQRGAR